MWREQEVFVRGWWVIVAFKVEGADPYSGVFNPYPIDMEIIGYNYQSKGKYLSKYKNMLWFEKSLTKKEWMDIEDQINV